jgi:hypothetical protein
MNATQQPCAKVVRQSQANARLVSSATSCSYTYITSCPDLTERKGLGLVGAAGRAYPGNIHLYSRFVQTRHNLVADSL